MNTRYPLAGLAFFALVAGPAMAAPAPMAEDASPRIMVSYGDLNLNTTAGQAVLATRIHRAAEKVCGPEPDSRDLARVMPYRQCMKQSADTAVAAIPTSSQLAANSAFGR